MEESFKDFDWDLNRFVEYRSTQEKKHYPIIKKKTNLDLGLELYLI
jgi:hypothetical protein